MKKVILILLWAVTWKEWQSCEENNGWGLSHKACQVERTEIREKFEYALGLADAITEKAPRTSDVKVYEMHEIKEPLHANHTR